jgi:hypothetical protein
VVGVCRWCVVLIKMKVEFLYSNQRKSGAKTNSTDSILIKIFKTSWQI